MLKYWMRSKWIGNFSSQRIHFILNCFLFQLVLSLHLWIHIELRFLRLHWDLPGLSRLSYFLYWWRIRIILINLLIYYYYELFFIPSYGPFLIFTSVQLFVSIEFRMILDHFFQFFCIGYDSTHESINYQVTWFFDVSSILVFK